MAGEQVLTEHDDDRAGGTVIDATIPPGIAGNRDGAPRQPQARQPEEEFEVILDDGEGGGGEGGGEGRVTTEEVGARPVLEQQQRRAEGGKVYSREEIEQMSPEQRRRAWRDMPREEQRLNRPLDRARRKDNALLGKRENDELKGIVSRQQETIEQLTARVNGFAPKFGEFEKSQVQSRLQNVNGQLADVERSLADGRRRMAAAMGEQDHEAVSRIIEEQGTAFIKRAQLQNAKQQFEQQLNAAPAAGGDQAGARRDAGGGDQQQQRRQEQQQPRQKSREELEFKRDFQEEFPQFNNEDPDDEDSQLVIHLDGQVARRFNPATPEYWEELRDRIEEHLPHWFDRQSRGRQGGNGRQQAQGRQQTSGQRQQTNGQQMRRGPATGAGGEATPGPGQKTQVKLSKERRDAMVLANVLDRDGTTVIDKPKFRRMIAKYQEFDREQSGRLTA
jgi:hypothetical protein